MVQKLVLAREKCTNDPRACLVFATRCLPIFHLILAFFWLGAPELLDGALFGLESARNVISGQFFAFFSLNWVSPG